MHKLTVHMLDSNHNFIFLIYCVNINVYAFLIPVFTLINCTYTTAEQHMVIVKQKLEL